MTFLNKHDKEEVVKMIEVLENNGIKVLIADVHYEFHISRLHLHLVYSSMSSPCVRGLHKDEMQYRPKPNTEILKIHLFGYCCLHP